MKPAKIKQLHAEASYGQACEWLSSRERFRYWGYDWDTVVVAAFVAGYKAGRRPTTKRPTRKRSKTK